MTTATKKAEIKEIETKYSNDFDKIGSKMCQIDKLRHRLNNNVGFRYVDYGKYSFIFDKLESAMDILRAESIKIKEQHANDIYRIKNNGLIKLHKFEKRVESGLAQNDGYAMKKQELYEMINKNRLARVDNGTQEQYRNTYMNDPLF